MPKNEDSYKKKLKRCDRISLRNTNLFSSGVYIVSPGSAFAVGGPRFSARPVGHSLTLPGHPPTKS